MIITQKLLGETPLECLERLRHEQPELIGGSNAKLSYAGRLDPMAEGAMLVLVGDEENSPHQRAKFLGLDKEYVATFLVGVKTDSGDALGLVEMGNQNVVVTEDDIKKQIMGLRNVHEQTYPWFSGKTVDGVKLFEHFKAGNFAVERPTQHVEIKEVELLRIETQTSAQLQKYMYSAIEKVRGDFRQKEILETWQKFFAVAENFQFQIFEVRFVASSGTFIRALTEEFSFPAVLLKLKRTAIHGFGDLSGVVK